MLDIRVLGLVVVRIDRQEVRIGSRTQRLVLAALARDPGQPVSREQLSDLIWGDDRPEAAVGSLKSHVSRLRTVLADDVIEARSPGYALTTDPAQVDAHRFESLVERARSVDEVDQALALWRGDPFGEFTDHPYFAAASSRLEHLHVHARQRRAELLVDAGRTAEAVADLEALLTHEPLREPVWVTLVDALTAAGRPAEAVAAARRYREQIADVGLDPSPRFTAAEKRAFAMPESGRDGPDSPEEARSVVRLPRRLVSLVGRDDELARVTDLIMGRRVVTLTGPGGVGKTTLAVEAAHRTSGSFPDGVWLVPLADVEETGSVVAAIARVVGAPTTDPLDRAVRDYLAGRRALLLVDSAEHVHGAAAASVRDLVATTSELHVLVTSRRPLGMPGEVVVEVDSLDRPDAVALFAQRARDAGAALAPHQHELAASVCDRLDRLPLALEMAASRLRALALDELSARLHQRLGLLGTGRGQGRHQTLREVVAWSHDLLEESERSLLAQLSVFAGPFDLDTAEVVCDIDGEVVVSLADLVDASLVQRVDGTDGSRYELLETVRQFAAEQLQASGAIGQVTTRFVHHHAALLERIDRGLRGPDEKRWAARFDDQVANLEAAHHRALESGDVASAARLVTGTYLFVYQRLRADVGAWAEQMGEWLPRLDDALRAGVVAIAALNRLNRDDPVAAASLLDELPDDPAARHGHEVLSDLYLYRGDLDEAQHHAGRSADLAAAAGDRFTALFATAVQALARGYAGDTTGALQLVDQRRAAAAELGSPLILAWLDYTQAELIAETDPAGALALLDRTVAAADEAGWSLLAGVGRLTAGSIRARTPEPAEAAPAFRRLVDHWDRLGDRTHQWTTLRNLVELLARWGALEESAQLLGAVSTAPLPTYGSERLRLQDVRDRLAVDMGHETFDHHFRIGQGMAHDDAVRLARRALRS